MSFSPWGHRSCQKPAPVWAFHGVTASFAHPSAVTCNPPEAAGGICSPWTSKDCRGTAALLWSSAQPAGLSQLLKHLLPLPLHHPWRLQNCFSHFFSFLSSLARVTPAHNWFFPSYVCYPKIINTFSEWLGLGQQWLCLEPLGIGSVRHQGSC